MADLTEASTFDAGVYQIELTDPVQGGAGGLDNEQAQALANRTRYLKDQLASIDLSIYAPKASPTLTGTPTGPTPAAGDNSTKLATTAFVQALKAGIATVNVAGNSNVTLTQAQYGCGVIILTGAITGAINVVFPTAPGFWIVLNSTTGTFAITLKTSGGSGITITRTKARLAFCDGANIVDGHSDFGNAAYLNTGNSGATVARLDGNGQANAWATEQILAALAPSSPYSAGWRCRPPTIEIATRNLTLLDVGCTLKHADQSSQSNYTIPPVASVAWQPGSIIWFQNGRGAATMKITPGAGVTLYWNAGNIGQRTFGDSARCGIRYDGGDEWWVIDDNLLS